MTTPTDAQVGLPNYADMAQKAAEAQAAALAFQQQMSTQTMQFQTNSEALKNVLDSGKSAAKNIN